jgi:hypothetical protein
MGALIHTQGTGYLCWFYNSEFENNWAFHKANAAAYNRGGANWNVWNNLINTLYDPARQTYPLIPTPNSTTYPHLVQRWQYFFQNMVLTQANQNAMLDALYHALSTPAISGILFGVRQGSPQKIDSSTLNGAVQVQMINIVMVAAMPTGRNKSGALEGKGPPPIDL